MKRMFVAALLGFSIFGFSDEMEPRTNDFQDVGSSYDVVYIGQNDDFEAYVFQGVGYRYDRQENKIYYFGDPSILNTKIDTTGRNSAQLVLGIGTCYKGFFLKAQGDYGWMINGTQSIVNPGNNIDEPTFFPGFDLGAGYSADAQASFGYDWRAVEVCDFEFGIVPAVGYKYWHLMNWRKGEKRYDLPVPPVVLPAVLTGFALERAMGPEQQDWFGPYVEGGLNATWADTVRLDLFYQYHFLDARAKSSTATDIYVFFPATTLVSQQMYRFDNLLKTNKAYAQVGGLNLSFNLDCGWNLGLHFEGSRLWSHKATMTIKTTKNEYVLAPVGLTETKTNSQSTVSWTIYSTNLYASYSF